VIQQSSDSVVQRIFGKSRNVIHVLSTVSANLGVEIVCRLKKQYGDHALSRTQVYFWINDAKWGRTDLSTIASPGREPDEGLAVFIAGKSDADPHLLARNFAHSLGIATSTAYCFRNQVLGMKCRHLRWVSQTFTDAQKAMPAELAQSTLQALAKHQNINTPISISYSRVTRHRYFPPMITEQCGSLPGMMVRRFDDRHTSNRRLWSQSFSMELVSARSRFFHKDIK
jgi:hypothetical protein